MKRTPLSERQLPDYTKGEEIANTITHTIGAVLGAAALVLCVIYASIGRNPYRIVSAVVYGTSLVSLYTVSSVYHGMKTCTAKKVFQVLDHCMIYFLIGGTYTPIVLGPLREYRPVLGWTIFGIAWGLCIFGCVFTAIDHNKFRVLSMICYMGIGWVIVIAAKPTIAAVSQKGFFHIFAGGMVYTVGVIAYEIGNSKRYFHSLFHVFVVIGSVWQFIGVFYYCII